MSELSLPPGYSLDSYCVERVLGNAGGFGITYLATDTALGRKVAIKELLPHGIATRAGREVVPQHSGTRESWEWALNSFKREARILAGFQHPNIVHAVRLLEANGTAYLVMEYLEGRTLEDFIRRRGTLSPELFRNIFSQILDGLEIIHQQHLIHRDIKPDNIYLTESGRAIILDFGAARPESLHHTAAVTQLIAPAYSPFEQYQSRGKTGPASDIYSAAATMARAITGNPPPPATDRLVTDTWEPLGSRTDIAHLARVLRAVDKALSVRMGDRPQSVAEWRRQLGWDFPELKPKPEPEKKAVILPQTRGLPPLPPLRDSPWRAVAKTVALLAAAVAGIGGMVAYGVQRGGNTTRRDHDSARHQTETSPAAAAVPDTSARPLSGDQKERGKSLPAGPVIHSVHLEDGTLEEGAKAVLRWNIQGAEELFVSPGIGSVQGYRHEFKAPPQDTTYEITARGPGGTATDTVTLKIGKAPGIAVTVPASHILGSGPLTIKWEVDHASSVKLNGTLCSPQGMESVPVGTPGNHKFEFVAENDFGTRELSREVAVTEDPSAEIRKLYENKVTAVLDRDLEKNMGEDLSCYAETVDRQDSYGTVSAERHCELERRDNRKYSRSEFISYWVEVLPRTLDPARDTIQARQYYFFQRMRISDRALFHGWRSREVTLKEISEIPKIARLWLQPPAGPGERFVVDAYGAATNDREVNFKNLHAILRSRLPLAASYPEESMVFLPTGRLRQTLVEGATLFAYPVTELPQGKKGNFLVVVNPYTRLP